MMYSLPVPKRLLLLAVCVSPLVPTLDASAAEANPAPPRITGSLATNGLPRLAFPYPAAQAYTVYGASEIGGPYTAPVPGWLSGPTFTVTNPAGRGFYQVSVTPMSSNALFSATVLNRLTYGPSPADIERINSIGPEQFIAEQLAADTIVENLDTAPPILNEPPPPPPFTNWIRVSTTGTTTGTNFGFYLSASGVVYLDDIRLVTGDVADVGANLLANGDFEDPTRSPPWFVGADFAGSVITNSPTVDGQAASGTNCLRVVARAGTTGLTSGIWQPFGTTNPPTQRYTLSFSYLPYPNPGTNVLTVRLSGTAATRTVTLPSNGPVPPAPPAAVSPIVAKLASATPPVNIDTIPPVLTTIADLRAYHKLRAVQSKRQLYEILVQFFENHFTTEYQKIEDYLDNTFNRSITNDNVRRNYAVELEWREHQRFRQALLSPDCTFLDLLTISIESPTMIIYLDTVLSTRSAPNENYAREILELHTMGADNGYVQQDIVELARVWTGWSVAKKHPSDAGNPFAPAQTNPTNDPGVFTLHFRSNVHTTNSAKRLFTNVVIEPRFGPFRGGQPYGLTIGTNAYPGTNGMAEGYVAASYLANLPQTMEFLSVKLCQVFVHEGFEHGVYDYGSPATPEAQLVKECMTAWDTPAADGRKGNIRSVLQAIFNSALFRGHAASQQKIKTPLEFAISAIRALRLETTDASGYVSTTADTDGYALASPLSRMGGMGLFNRPEPDGFSEFGRNWLSTANLDERWRFAQHLLMASSYGLKNTDYGTRNNTSDPSGLIRSKLPSASWNDPAAIADFFLSILYPGEGAGNLGQDRQAAIDFLNTNEAGAPSAFNFAAHDGRVRGMVALLMCFPRFQEQ
jgi:uncharacterized protein (DUF1800 family)